MSDKFYVFYGWLKVSLSYDIKKNFWDTLQFQIFRADLGQNQLPFWSSSSYILFILSLIEVLYVYFQNLVSNPASFASEGQNL